MALLPRLAIASTHDHIALRSGPLPPTDDGSIYGALGPVEQAKIPPPSELGKRDSRGCDQLSVDDAKRMKGWDKIVTHANKRWGNGKRRIVTNLKGDPNRTATICPNEVDIKFGDGSRCELDGQYDSPGEPVGTNGTTRVTGWQGYQVFTQLKVTRALSFGSKTRVSTAFRISKIFDYEGSVTTAMNITNAVGSEFKTTFYAMTNQEKRAVAKEGETCYGTMDAKDCDGVGKGRLRYTASGWVWFIYEAPTGPEEDKKKNWAVNIDKLLSVDERSSDLEFSGEMKGFGQFNLRAVCKKSSLVPEPMRPPEPGTVGTNYNKIKSGVRF
ncbi:hypothetical protein BD779DRAFT_1672425 [Infundibulicybe gibba]|nr:hypothetical protein BD779DRAFT_1672425 [Infundibulicybe gibba]